MPTFEELYGPWICAGCGKNHPLGVDCYAGPDICPTCGKHFEIGDWPFDCAGLGHAPGSFWLGDAQVHASEKVVVHEGPNGEIRIPGRGDRPIHPKLAAEGYVRKELNTISDIRAVEKKTGLIHERSSYDANSAQADRDLGSS